MSSLYWRQQVLKHLKLIEHWAQKHFSNSQTADEAVLYVLDQLERDDWKRVRRYDSSYRSSFPTYLTVVVRNLFRDFYRHKFKPLRPPSWLKKQGKLFEKVFRYLCQENMSIEDTIHTICQDSENPQCSFNVEEAVALILHRITTCGKYIGEPISVDDENFKQQKSVSPYTNHIDPHAFLAAKERTSLIEILGQLLLTGDTVRHQGSIQSTLNNLKKTVQLSAEERLILKLIYIEGDNVSTAGARLNLKVNQVHGKHKRLLKKIQTAIVASGIEKELREMLRDDAYEYLN